MTSSPASKKTIYVIGNGPSLSLLTPEQIRLINQSESICVNAYILNYQKIGLIPKHYLLLDSNDATQKTLAQVPNILNQPDWQNVHAWLSAYWYKQVPQRPNTQLVNYTAFHEIAPVFARKLWTLSAWQNNAKFLHRIFDEYFHGPFSQHRLQQWWAESYHDKLFWFRGVLTTALNLSWIMGYQTVKLVGVDLNDGTHFYKEYPSILERDKKKLGGIDTLTQHGTTVPNNGAPSIIEVLRQIRVFYELHDRNILCVNKTSRLVHENIIPYAPI